MNLGENHLVTRTEHETQPDRPGLPSAPFPGSPGVGSFQSHREKGRRGQRFPYCTERQLSVRSVMRGGDIPGTQDVPMPGIPARLMDLLLVLPFFVGIRRGWDRRAVDIDGKGQRATAVFGAECSIVSGQCFCALMLPNLPGGVLLGGEKNTGCSICHLFSNYGQDDPRLSANDNNPKIINDTSKIPYLLKVLWQGCGAYCFLCVNVP